MVKKRKEKLSAEEEAEMKLIKAGIKFENTVFGKIKKYFHIHLDNYGSTHGRWIEGTLFFFNFLAIVLFVIDTHNPTGAWGTFIHTSEFILVSIFVVEYIARMWVAQRKVRHFFNPYSIIDLLAILPILINFVNLTFFRMFRILRLFRMLRILRFQRMFKQKDTMFGQLSDTQLIVIRIVLTVFTIIFVSSGLIWAAETKANPDYGTIWDAMYFAVVTLSTVGYGDIAPNTPIGQFIASIIMILGYGIIAIPTGIVTSEMTKANAVHTNTQSCPNCLAEEHVDAAEFCYKCSNKLN